MTAWYKPIIGKLVESGLSVEVTLIGAKVQASLDEVRFLDIHYDPMSRSYSYAVTDLTLPYGGDKRVFGWDDYPHEGVPETEALSTYPHHSTVGNQRDTCG
ncbi:MAG: toxin-antitoxin system TumE family protein [Anaerolineae bacterium]